jgi:GT2 family glycosyltransferase
MISLLLKYLNSRFKERQGSPAAVSIVENCRHSPHTREPSVTIVIPTRDNLGLLEECIDSIRKKTTYSNFQLLIVDNDSIELETQRYFETLEAQGERVIRHPYKFNFAEICNIACNEIQSDFVCFLNNDTKVIEGEWLTRLVTHASEPDVGVVGSLLLFPNGQVQHAGIALGYRGVAGHVYANEMLEAIGSDVESLNCLEVSAVTFACALVARDKFFQLGGLDSNFRVGLNDVDFCMTASTAGFRNIVCMGSVLMHHESKSRVKTTSIRGILPATKEILRLLNKHGDRVFQEHHFKGL